MTPYQEINSLRDEIDRLKETIVRLKDRNMEAIQIGQATARAQERERLQGEHDHLHAQISQLQGELEESRKETASVRQELQAKTRELADLQGSLNRGIKTYKEVMSRTKYADSQIVNLTLRKLLD